MSRVLGILFVAMSLILLVVEARVVLAQSSSLGLSGGSPSIRYGGAHRLPTLYQASVSLPSENRFATLAAGKLPSQTRYDNFMGTGGYAEVRVRPSASTVRYASRSGSPSAYRMRQSIRYGSGGGQARSLSSAGFGRASAGAMGGVSVRYGGYARR